MVSRREKLYRNSLLWSRKTRVAIPPSKYGLRGRTVKVFREVVEEMIAGSHLQLTKKEKEMERLMAKRIKCLRHLFKILKRTIDEIESVMGLKEPE